MNIVERFVGNTSTPVTSVAAATAMPAGLVAAPGVYTFNGVNYDCTVEGLVKFWDPVANAFRNLIVYQSNVEALMSALAWLTVNGKGDEALSIADKTNKARYSKLNMLCGKTVEWALAICSSAGVLVQARMVRSLTAGTPNNYYDGHVLIEAKVGGAWKLFDLSNNQSFATSGGGVSLREVLPLISSTTATAIAGDVEYASEANVPGSFDVVAWMEETMRTPTEKRSECERILQIPGIDSAGLTYFYLPAGMESREAWVLSLQASFRVITKAAWETMFYS